MPTGRRGFALLVTISLVAFLVLILVALATLTRVETQVATNSQQQAQARQNALFALNIALGELQKYTGPDQRTTARSDMDAALADSTTASGRWLGAYGNGAPADYDQAPSVVSAAIIVASDNRGSQAKLLNWLVSGNENTAFDPAANVGPAGNITTPPSQFQFTPSGAVTGLVAGVSALDTGLTVADRTNAPRPARLLVGPGTASDSVSDYVVAPVREISADMPALGTDPVTIGRYAWWVGDEGAKARVNLPMANATQAPLAFSSAQRAAVELMDGVNPSAGTTLASSDMLDPTGATSLYNPSAAQQLSKLLSPDQLPMMSSASPDDVHRATRYRYHDLTAFSTSVLSDTYAGGLKRDLSALLAAGASAPDDADHLFPPEGGLDFGVPTWGQLRSFAQTTADASGLTPRTPSATEGGIAPVMTYAALGLQYAAPGGFAPGGSLRLAVFPVVVLWNPYTTPIRASRYEFGILRRFTGESWIQLQEEGPPDADGNPTWVVKQTLSLQRAGGTDSTYFRFVIDAEDIPPGQSLVYTLPPSASGVPYDAPSSGPPGNVLRPGFNPTGHVLMPSSATISSDATPATNYRVAVNRSSPNAVRTISQHISYSYINANNMTNGEVCAYLGEVVATQPAGFDATIGNKRWYQFLSRLSTGAGPAHSSPGSGLLQGPEPITGVTLPVFTQTIKARFAESPLRWIAQSNPRAFLVTRPARPAGETGDGIDSVPAGYGANSTNSTWPQFSVSIDDRASSGLTLDTIPDTLDTTLFEFRPSDQPLLGIGHLQHANLGWVNSHPAYAIGNSLADYRFRDKRHQVVFETNASGTMPTNLITAYYDFSWLLNRALWGRHFVSTVPHAGTGRSGDTSTTPIPAVLSNPRHVFLNGHDPVALRDPERAASQLLLAGGFNINSTSEQAWRAVLGGVNRLPYDPVAGSVGAPLAAAFSRFSRPTAPADPASAPWQGFRQLDETQVARLARDIVAEIRARGPFVSLHDFVNRRLVDSAATTDRDERLKGVLQAALDAATTGSEAANSGVAVPFDDAPAYTANQFYDIDAMRGGSASVAPYSSKSAFAPQYLTQADILSAIGSGLSARSDTFVIRTYGEALNPALALASPEAISARAWCEAIVQRLPDHMDSALAPHERPAPGTLNHQHGRRLKIISFRWLSANDI